MPIIPDQNNVPPAPPIQPAHISKIPDWAEAIRQQEGWAVGSRSYTNKNPGNLKASEYTMSLGAIRHDADMFCVFPDEATGTKALCTFLTDAANNQLKPYHNVTLRQFTLTYANPPNQNYVNGVATHLKVSPDIFIKELL